MKYKHTQTYQPPAEQPSVLTKACQLQSNPADICLFLYLLLYPLIYTKPAVCVPSFLRIEISHFRAEIEIFLTFQILITDFICKTVTSKLITSQQETVHREVSSLATICPAVLVAHKQPRSPELPEIPLPLQQPREDESSRTGCLHLWASVQAGFAN